MSAAMEKLRKSMGERLGGQSWKASWRRRLLVSFEDEDELHRKEEKRVVLSCRWLSSNPNFAADELCGFWRWARDSTSLKFSFYILENGSHTSIYLIGLVRFKFWKALGLASNGHSIYKSPEARRDSNLNSEAVRVTSSERGRESPQKPGLRDVCLGHSEGYSCLLRSGQPRKGWKQGSFIIKTVLLLMSC